jgi:hypothetical protein
VVGLRLVHAGIVHGQFNQFLNLAGDAPPFGQSDDAGLGLVSVAFPVRPDRKMMSLPCSIGPWTEE